jgi:hypothetical protein
MYYRCPARDVDRYDSEVVENATTSYTALSYAKALLASGDVKKSLKW